MLSGLCNVWIRTAESAQGGLAVPLGMGKAVPKQKAWAHASQSVRLRSMGPENGKGSCAPCCLF